MPRCGATFDENAVPPWTKGDFRGVLGGEYQPTPALRDRVDVFGEGFSTFTPSDGGDFQRRLSGRRNWDTVL